VSQERTGAWLARKTGKSPAYVTKVLNGSRRPSPDFKARASEALGVPEHLIFPAEAA
jgi:transcriptional regulator with XRE-family HTH domain